MKSRLLITILISIIIFTLITPLSAQDTSNQQFPCDLPSLQKTIDVFIGELGKLKVGGETDTAKISNTLQEISNAANIMRASCDNLAFSGKKQAVLGPIEFPAGLYKATAKTDGYMIATVTAVEGECGQGSGSFLTPGLFIVSKGQAIDGAETIFSSKGCKALIEISNIQSDWSLNFERLTTN